MTIMTSSIATRLRRLFVAGALVLCASPAFALPDANITPAPPLTVNFGSFIFLNSDTSVPGEGNVSFDSTVWETPIGTIISGASSVNVPAPAVSGAGPQFFTVRLTVVGFPQFDQDFEDVSIRVNRAPIANAGSPQTVAENSGLVTLNGSASTDEDGDTPLTFAWIQLSGPTVTINNNNTAMPNFSAPNVVGPGSVVCNFRLTVTDPLGASSIAQVAVTVTNVNQPPVANDQYVSTNEDTPQTITLTASDPDGNPLTYTIVSPPTHCQISSIVGANVTYIPCPNYFGPDSFTFRVNDGTTNSNVATIFINIDPVNDAPIANAGVDQTRVEGSGVQLAGTATDIDTPQVLLTFEWTQISGPAVTILNPTLPNASFVAPEVSADSDIILQMRVTDDGALSSTDTVTVTVLNFVPGNFPPTNVNAGPDRSVSAGSVVDLSASADDVDGDPLTFRWRQIAGPAVAISSPTSMTGEATFIAPAVSADTLLTFEVTVTDGRGGVGFDTVSFVVRDPAQALLATPVVSDLAIFPSPFNAASGVTIRYQLREPAAVKITIVDVFGRTVRELSTASGAAGGGAAGNNQVFWDGKNGEGDRVGNGAYIVQIEATDNSGNRGKMRERVGVRN